MRRERVRKAEHIGPVDHPGPRNWKSPMLSIGYDNPGTEPVTAGLLYSPKLRIESEVLMDPWLVDPRTKQGGPSRPALLFFGIARGVRSEEHTSELQSLMRTSYAVFCLKKKKTTAHLSYNAKH